MGTGQMVRKEIQCAFNFVWKIMLAINKCQIWGNPGDSGG